MNLSEALEAVTRRYPCIAGDWLENKPGLEEQMRTSGKPIGTLYRAAKLMGYEGSPNPFREHFVGNCKCSHSTKL